jgi:hypothetical protein
LDGGLRTILNLAQVSIVALQRLLVELKERKPNVCFRFRVMGEMWHPNFVRIISINDKTVMLLDQQANKLLTVNLSLIVQFEIDIGYQEYSPNFHYTVEHLI